MSDKRYIGDLLPLDLPQPCPICGKKVVLDWLGERHHNLEGE